MILASIFGFLGQAVGGFFGLKKEQGEAIKEAIKAVGDVNSSEGQRESAIATVIAAENASGYWLSAVWRPLTMVVFLGIIVSYWFGYAPPGLMVDKMPPMMERLFDILQLGIGGYIGGRTIEKVISSLSLGSVLKSYIAKKLA